MVGIIKPPVTGNELALQQAYRALAVMDKDRQGTAAREQALLREISELRKLIDEWFRPQIKTLEHRNSDLGRRCRAAEERLLILDEAR